MSHDNYVALGISSDLMIEKNSQSFRPPQMPHPKSNQNNIKRRKEICWPFLCCCGFKRNDQEGESNDGHLLLENMSTQKAMEIKCNERDSLDESVDRDNSESEERLSLSPPVTEEDEENYPGSDLQNAIALSLQVYVFSFRVIFLTPHI